MNTANLTDRASGSGKRNEKSVTKSFAATLGFGKRDKAKPLAPASTSASASTKAKATKTRRRFTARFSLRSYVRHVHPVDMSRSMVSRASEDGSSVRLLL